MRCKTGPVRRLECPEPRCDLVDASLTRVVDGPAMERREARAEDHSGVEQVGVGDDTISETGDGFVDHRQNEPVLDIVGDTGRVTRRFDSLAVNPIVKPLAGFAAQLAGIDFGF